MGRRNQAYEYLKNAIINNEIPPGTHLKEAELAQTLKMSRSPIREALRELESEGVIESYPARGSVVQAISPYDVEEIYELRTLLEMWALEKAFSRITDKELDELAAMFSAALDQMDVMLLHVADTKLHNMIVEKSGSKRLSAFIRILNTQIERIRRFGYKDPNRIKSSHKEHMQIIDLMRAHDLGSCKKALREHLRSVSDSAIEASKFIYMSQH